MVFVSLVDLPYHCLHGLPGAGVLTGKENTKAGTNDQPDQADNDDDSYAGTPLTDKPLYSADLSKYSLAELKAMTKEQLENLK